MHREHLFSYVAVASVAVSFASGACRADSSLPSLPEITLHVPASAVDRATVEVKRLTTSCDSAAIASDPDQWQSLLAITLVHSGSQDPPAVEGAYTVTDTGVEFTPQSPLDPLCEYHVAFDPALLPGLSLAAARVATVISPPRGETAPPTFVTTVYPSADLVPENLLRMYVEFSGPMGDGTSREFVRLVNQAGDEVAISLPPVDADSWNPDLTLSTVFFDPGDAGQVSPAGPGVGRDPPCRASLRARSVG